MGKSVTIYHNPRCSKSRQALAILQDKDVELIIVEYLQTPLTQSALKTLISQLGIAPEALVRKGEEVFKENYKGRDMSDADWIAAMAEHPILMERPVVVSGTRAVVARPPERVNEVC